MKYFLPVFFLLPSLSLFSQTAYVSSGTASPLATYSNAWNDIKYSKCNTAANASYLSSDEKEIIYILNLIRTNPVLFCNTVLKKYPAASGKGYLTDDKFYYQSLVNTLAKMQPINILTPDKACFESAKSHALSSGINGYVGHKRITVGSENKKTYNGECCDYGNSDPLEIVLSLLIDEGVPSLGHRNLILNSYNKVGVSIKPHKKYGTNAVIDFLY